MKFFIIILSCITLFGCFSDSVYQSLAIKQFSHGQQIIKAADISVDGQFTLLADNSSVCLWHNQSNKLHHPCHTGEQAQLIEIVKVAKNNQFYVTSNRVFVNLYDAANGKQLGQWSDGENIINDIAMSYHGDILLLGFRSGKATVINTKSGQVTLFEKHRLDINSVDLSDDGKLAFTGSSDKIAKLWQTNNGKELQVFEHRSRVNHLDISADGKVGFSVDALNGRFFWDLSKGEKVAELDTVKRFIEFNDSVFSADNQWFLTGSPKQKINLWRVSDGAMIGEWQAKQQRQRAAVLGVAFNEQQQIISETSDGIAEVWSLPPSVL